MRNIEKFDSGFKFAFLKILQQYILIAAGEPKSEILIVSLFFFGVAYVALISSYIATIPALFL